MGGGGGGDVKSGGVFFFFFFFFRPLGEHPRNYNCSATKLLFGYVHTTPDCFCAATKVMQGFCSHLTGMVVAARFLWRNEADLHISDRFVPYFGAGRKTIRTVAEINNQERELGPPEMEVSIQECQGGKTFCASFCAFLIAGSRRAFLCVDDVLTVFVCCWSSEWNARGANVCSL